MTKMKNIIYSIKKIIKKIAAADRIRTCAGRAQWFGKPLLCLPGQTGECEQQDVHIQPGLSWSEDTSYNCLIWPAIPGRWGRWGTDLHPAESKVPAQVHHKTASAIRLPMPSLWSRSCRFPGQLHRSMHTWSIAHNIGPNPAGGQYL